MNKMLEQRQKWLGAMIAQPLQEDNHMSATTPFGSDVKEEASQYIAASKTLEPYQRIEIYHQQYWWRLLKTMQENFPLVCRLFGYSPFNLKIAVPYLSQNPPTHWALAQLGQTLPQWIRNHYTESDQELVSTAAEIDAASQRAFWKGSLPPINFTELSDEERLSQKIYLQPHLHLFALKANFFSFREALLKEKVEYWNTHPFPEISYGAGYFVVYRDLKNRVQWKEIPCGAYTLLSYLQEGNTLGEACANIEAEGGRALEEASEQIPLWLQEWTAFRWFGKKVSV